MYLIEQSDGSSVELRDIQYHSLKMLKVFDEFCDEFNLKYTLCGGCCIGALRHGGFIPWDDDIDVHMFREDYEKFYELWKIHGQTYSVVRTTQKTYNDTMLTQLSDPNTTFIKSNQVDQDIDHGIKLEIIPLDGAPRRKVSRIFQLIWANVFYLFNRGFVPENKGKVVATVSKLILSIYNTPEKRVPIWKFAEKRMTKYSVNDSDYVTELCVTWKYMKIKYPKSLFLGERKEKFEDDYFPVPFKAEEYLSLAFGDYMKLPNKSQRVPKHETSYIDLENSWKKYKGVYYLVEREENNSD